MTNSIGNKHVAQQRSKAERKRIKQSNIVMEAGKKALAKAKYRNEVKGRISAAQAARLSNPVAAMNDKVTVEKTDIPAGGWGSAKEVGAILLHEHVMVKGSALLAKQNKPEGFACVSCSWAKPANPHPFEFCESGAKATAWEITPKKPDLDFFDRHTVSELEQWSDHELEDLGRLTVPMRWDAANDKYVETSWDAAYAEIGAELRRLDPRSVVFYSSGRASLETSYMYQLLARMYGNNNLPDSSNMCHESTSVALPKTIGVACGTVVLDDF